MKKYNLSIKMIICIVFIFVLFLIKNIVAKDIGYIYVAPSSTDVMYGDDTAYLVSFNSNGYTKSYKTEAYPFSGLVSFGDELIYQDKKGIRSFKDGVESLKENLSIDEDTIGYNMSQTLNKEYYYFLCNESFKDSYYSSKLIIGDKNDQYKHEIKGFINSYGNDEDNIYLLTDDMINKNNKQIQKIAVKGIDNINTKVNNISFNTEVESNFRMIIFDEFIYAFVIRDSSNVSILKISKSTLEVEDIINVIEFDSNKDGDSYYPISTNAIFKKDDKIYYPTIGGKVYSFDVSNNKFEEEFTLEDYTMKNCSNPLLYFHEKKDEINILFYDEKNKEYYIYLYNIDGKIVDKVKLKSLKIEKNHYPHNFIIVK